ncbi:hypothetical protein [Chachezhania sediminis]|uniref:hypothetical protein n=1 Tax=Chachezhania sediminis TaxID=2599291 RepID=UPI00131B8273|nr:hypothetical protein [Chachezhania sediminis]
MSGFLHVTTLIPVGIEAQLDTLGSWHKAHGQPIHAFNHSREFAAVKDHVPDWIVPHECRFPQGFGRDYLPFTALLDGVRGMDPDPETRVLLVNSDIGLKDPGALPALDDAAQDLVFASRIDIEADGTPSARYGQGYDVFSIRAGAMDMLDLPGFSLGIPWWDYVLPLTAVLAGRKVKRLETEAFTHVLHPQRWSLVAFDHLGWEVMRALPADAWDAIGRNGANGSASDGAWEPRTLRPGHDLVLDFARAVNGFLNDPVLAGGAAPEDLRAACLARLRDIPVPPEPLLLVEPVQAGPVAGGVAEEGSGTSDGGGWMQAHDGSVAFAGLMDQIAGLGTGEPVAVTGGHADLGPDLWLSTDPAGTAELAVEPRDEGFALSLVRGNSGGWACLGMRIAPEVVARGRYVGVLLRLRSDALVSIRPTLRYFPEGQPLVDVAAEPVVLPAGTHTALAHIPVDADLARRSGRAELNLYVHTDTMRADVLALEPLLLS